MQKPLIGMINWKSSFSQGKVIVGSLSFNDHTHLASMPGGKVEIISFDSKAEGFEYLETPEGKGIVSILRATHPDLPEK